MSFITIELLLHHRAPVKPIVLASRLPVHPWEACSGPWPYPTFDAQVIEDKVLDGYAVTVFDVNNDGLNDVVTHGLALGNVVWYENPTWVKHNISQLSKPVQSAPFDVDGDGFMDIGIGEETLCMVTLSLNVRAWVCCRDHSASGQR